jgi:hypothetical protein
MEFLIDKFAMARRLLNQIVFEVCRKSTHRFRHPEAWKEYFTIHTEKNFNCCFKFSPNPRMLQFKPFKDIGLNGEYEYGMDILRRGCLIMLSNSLVVEVC